MNDNLEILERIDTGCGCAILITLIAGFFSWTYWVLAIALILLAQDVQRAIEKLRKGN